MSLRTSLRSQLEGTVRFSARAPRESETISGSGSLQNTSTGGICLITEQRLPSGGGIELNVSSCGEEFRFRGKIAHIEESKLGYVVGVCFDIDNPYTEESIVKLASLGAE